MQISLLIHEVFCKQQQCRSVCSYANSGANNRGQDQPAQWQSLVQTMMVQISLPICAGTNNSVDQPAHLHSLMLALSMLTNVGPTRINNVGPTLNQRNQNYHKMPSLSQNVCYNQYLESKNVQQIIDDFLEYVIA